MIFIYFGIKIWLVQIAGGRAKPLLALPCLCHYLLDLKQLVLKKSQTICLKEFNSSSDRNSSTLASLDEDEGKKCKIEIPNT